MFKKRKLRESGLSPSGAVARLSVAVAALIFVSVQAQARVACEKVHEPYYFTHLTGEPPVEVIPLRRGEPITSASQLVQEAQAALARLGVGTQKRSFLYFSRLEISPTGDHPLNKMAAQLYRRWGTKIVYKPINLKEAEASYSTERNLIYISHRTAHTGALDLPFFHELTHMLMERKARKDPTLMDMEQSFSSRDGLAIDRSGHVGFMSFQEARTYTYEMKLFLKNLMRTEAGIHFGLELEIGSRIQMIENVLTDIQDSLALHRETLQRDRYRMQFEREQPEFGNSIYLHNLDGTLKIPLSQALVAQYQSLGSSSQRKEFLRQTAMDHLSQAEAVIAEAMPLLKPIHAKTDLSELVRVFERVDAVLRASFEAHRE